MVKDEKSFRLDGRKLFIGIPAYDGKLNIQSAFQLPQLAMAATKYQFALRLSHLSGCSIITRARNSLVHEFMESDATEMLFIDADVNFKVDDVLRIMALGSDKDVVCGAYPRRAKDQMFFTDIWFNEHEGVEIEDGLLRIKRAGTGFMFIRRHVIQKLMDDHPEWKFHVAVEGKEHYSIFDFKSTPEGYIGEDYLFCDRVTEAGFKIYIDPEINLGHFGQMEFTGHFGNQVLDRMIEDTLPDLKVVNG